MTCESCGEEPKKCNKDFTKAVIEINNPEQIILMRKVSIPASMGDDTTVPPAVGKYHNVILYYEANQKSYLYSSDGIPTLLANGLTDYEQAVNLPEINGHTLLGNQTGSELDLQNTLSVIPGTGIKLENDELSGIPATDTTIGMVKPGVGLEVDENGEISISNIDEYAHFFDTVADMKAATNLVAGDYARTLGFHSINDGGGALYKISNTGAANEMDIIAVGELYANLVYGERIDVKKLGAHGDDTNDDSAVFTRAKTIASTNGIVMYIPKATYKLTSQINLKAIILECDGTLDNDEALILGAHSGGGNTTKVYIFKCNDVQIEGCKRCYLNIRWANDITMFADGNDASIASQGYNKIDGINCNSFTINGVNNGWINENVINIKRCVESIIITGDGTYFHNNNRFPDVCMEGATDVIRIDYGHDNFISYRGESAPQVTIANDYRNFGNKVVKQYANLFYRVYDGQDIDVNTTFNFIGNEELPTAKLDQIMDVNVKNVKHLNTTQAINNNGLIFGNYQIEYKNSNIDPTKPFTLLIKSDVASQRAWIKCYDENGEGMQAYVRSSTITWNEDEKRYKNNSDLARTSISYYPTEGVKRIEINVVAGTHAFSWAKAYLATPLLNFDGYGNEINTEKKYRTSAPTATQSYWEVGDMVYNSAPTAGGVVGWICVEAGNPGTWKAFGNIAS